MTFAEKLQFECIKRGVYPNGIVRSLGFSKNAYTYWKKTNHAPSEDNIKRIAEKMGMTSEELMEGVDGNPAKLCATDLNTANNSFVLNYQEQDIIKIYRSMSLKKQIKLLTCLVQIADEEQI